MDFEGPVRGFRAALAGVAAALWLAQPVFADELKGVALVIGQSE